MARFVAGLDVQEFADDVMVRSAVAYQLVIIGEAVGHLSQALRDRYPEVPWKAIKGLRNIAAHEYHRVDHQTVWAAAAFEVPRLAEQVGRIRDEVEAQAADRDGLDGAVR